MESMEIYERYQHNYQIKIADIKKRFAENKKIRVGFFMHFLPSFASVLYECFKNDEAFSVKIVVQDTIFRKNYQDEFAKAQEIYGKDVVLSSYSADGRIRNFDNYFDVIVFGAGYDSLVPDCQKMEHFAELGVLTVYIPYGLLVSTTMNEAFGKGRTMGCLWRYYIDTKATYEEYIKYSAMKERNGRYLGYPKMDKLPELSFMPKGRKRVIIASHHSIFEDSGVRFSCFMRYYDFFIRLAKWYPQTDFVFRPHPVWEQALGHYWPKEMIDEYYARIEELPNMFLHTDPNYFDLFLTSHAMINDCGSYLAEYMFTGKPLCFLSKGKIQDRMNYNEHFAQKCIKNHYTAICELEILEFLENVVLRGNDFMKEQRTAFFEKEVRGAWPHSSEKIYQDIKNSILG